MLPWYVSQASLGPASDFADAAALFVRARFCVLHGSAAIILSPTITNWLWIRKEGRPSSAGQLVLLGELRALKGFALGTNAEKLKRPRERQKERVDIRTFLGELDRRSRRPEPDTRSELQRRTQRGVPHVVGLAR